MRQGPMRQDPMRWRRLAGMSCCPWVSRSVKPASLSRGWTKPLNLRWHTGWLLDSGGTAMVKLSAEGIRMMTSYRAKTRLYVVDDLPGSGQLVLDRDQSHYVATVMRQGPGAKVALFNGRDGEWLAEIVHSDRKQVDLVITAQLRPQGQEPDLWYVFAPLKKARLDYMVQKATEMGASALVPIFTERTVAERIKIERMTANTVEAAEQTERLSVPKVHQPIGLNNLLDSWGQDRKILFCDECAQNSDPVEQLRAQQMPGGQMEPWAVFVGPEGGFSEKERQRLLCHPLTLPISLGPRVLRADTAAVAALTLWQSFLGDWRGSLDQG